jgi:hypothetical protein
MLHSGSLLGGEGRQLMRSEEKRSPEAVVREMKLKIRRKFSPE